ncbi:MAG: hypothetical protein K2I14_00645 [Eubacterium sp.]|nr:hypothetical protein [Eubacterium sp.]
MKHVKLIKLICLFCLLFLLFAAGGCALNSYSVDELKVLYPKAIENSLHEELYYWKETVNAADYSSWRTCNVYAEMDKKFEIIRDEDGAFSNMKIDVYDEYNKKGVYKALCGKSQSAKGGETESFLFENDYDDLKNPVHYRKTAMQPQEFVKSEAFKSKYSLDAVLGELEYLTVDDMDFETDNKMMEHKGKVVKFSFKVNDDYIQRYHQEFGKASVFEGSKYAVIEFAYDRVASIVVFSEEKLGKNLSVDKEIYKLEIVYYGPKISIPSYDSGVWAEVK